MVFTYIYHENFHSQSAWKMYKNEISSQDSTKRQEGFLKRNLRGEEGMGNTNTTLKELVSQGLKD